MGNRYLSAEDAAWLCKNYSYYSNEYLARRLHKSTRCIAYWACTRNLHKTLDYLRRSRQKGAMVTNSRRKVKV